MSSMISASLLVLALLVFERADASGCLGFEGKKVRIHNSYGYITRCGGGECGSTKRNMYPDTLSLEKSPSGAGSEWMLESGAWGACTLKSMDNDQYVMVCDGCLSKPYSAYINRHGVFLMPPFKGVETQWHMKKVGNKYNFAHRQLDSSYRYLSACRGCIRDSRNTNMVLAHDRFERWGTNHGKQATWEIEVLEDNSAPTQEFQYGGKTYTFLLDEENRVINRGWLHARTKCAALPGKWRLAIVKTTELYEALYKHATRLSGGRRTFFYIGGAYWRGQRGPIKKVTWDDNTIGTVNDWAEGYPHQVAYPACTYWRYGCATRLIISVSSKESERGIINENYPFSARNYHPLCEQY